MIALISALGAVVFFSFGLADMDGMVMAWLCGLAPPPTATQVPAARGDQDHRDPGGDPPGPGEPAPRGPGRPGGRGRHRSTRPRFLITWRRSVPET